jgi:polyketide synthase PksJ
MNNSKIGKQNVEDVLGLTAMQEGMLFHYLSNPSSKQYFEQIRLNLSGSIKIDLIKHAWQVVCRNNEMLRTLIRWEKLDEPVQIILKEKEIPIRVFDLSREKREKQLESLAKIIDDDRDEKIDISRKPMRITLCVHGEGQLEMLITFHHILYDGWSNGIILTEFLQAYESLLAGKKPPVIEKTKYKEFFKWYLSRDKEKQDQFWDTYLRGFDTRTLLPYDRNKLEDIRQVATHKVEISQSLKEQVDRCLQNPGINITLACLLFSAYGILLQKYNNSTDIIYGTTVAGRDPAVKGIENTVGLFINTLPVRFNAAGDHTGLQVFESLRNHLKERTGYEQSSLTEIKKYTDIGKESDLFDSIIVVDNYPLENIQPGGAAGINSYALFEMTNFDLTLQILPFDDKHNMEIFFHYNADLFEKATIERLGAHYVNILVGITGNPAKKISAIGMLSQEETKQILYEFNTPIIEYRLKKTIHDVIEEQVQKTPDNIAVISTENTGIHAGTRSAAPDSCEFLTYTQFNELTNKLAHMLREAGVKEDSRVVMLFPRSIDMIVAVLGILKAGAACIPLDIAYPEERNSFIIKDSEAGFLLTAKDINLDIEASSPIVHVRFGREKLEPFSNKNPENPVKPEDLSYIIYTSGSTGNPKGALLHHSGIVNHTYTKIDVLGIGEKDRVANNFSINVIASIWQILAPLFTGASLKLYSEEIEWDPYGQFKQVDADEVTVIEVIPPVLKAYLFMLDEGKESITLKKLRKIALTSEETKPFLVNKFYSNYTHIDLVDCYGQTECCDDILHYTIPVDTGTRKVPIGTPSFNTWVIVLNHHNQLQPVGVPGEICASGAGVMYGYWNRPDLSKEKIVPNPLDPDVMMYRTGDIGRWLPNGLMEYLGRLDHQVKIRGNRVELREIENHVLRFPSVREAAVVAREDKEDEKILYAFLVSAAEITASEIRQYLLETLPDYMVPAHFIALKQLPLTPNGKINRKELVKMEIEGSIATGAEYQPPKNEFETRIKEIWLKLLLDGNKEPKGDSIGTNDNFFDLGGHSLLLIKLKSQLEKAFILNREISIIELFNYPTIAHQAQFIRDNLKDKDKDADSLAPPQNLYSSSQQREGESLDPGRRSHDDIAVIGISLRIPGAKDIDEFWNNLVNGAETIEFFEEDELEGSKTEDFVKGSNKIVPACGVLGDIDLFDADFFGFNPREAEIVEPQQRLFLEHTWMALEDAGYGNAGEDYPGDVGIYAGVGLNTYLLNNVMANPKVVNSLGEFQTMIGNDKDFLSTRVAYKLNLKGPAFTVQCACSTSLVALHLARQGLLSHDCDMAIVGGVAVHVPEKTGYYYNEGGYLSPDGHCRAFDADAEGTVFGNGIGVVVLKRLAQADADNDYIYAVVKGTAINNDGSLKVGYTSPSEIGQAKVIAKALIEARVTPDTIGYIETHGTGTVLGDPVEMAALKRAYREVSQAGNSNTKKQYCAIASVKSNIGHLDIAAGVVGFIKAVLCLTHKQIPPSINVKNPNPIIDFADTPFYVNTELKDWINKNGKPRRAGVSSFGIGGTNAHVILEEWPNTRDHSAAAKRAVPSAAQKTPSAIEGEPPPFQLILLSARTQTALETMTGNLVDYLKKDTAADLADVAYTLKTGRKAFDHRLALVCRDKNDAAGVLTAFDPKRIIRHTRKPGDKSVVFMFPGVGEHYVNMAYELYHREPVFRGSVDDCCAILEPLLKKDLREVLFVQGLRKNKEAEEKTGPSSAKINFKKMINRENKPLSKEEELLSRTIFSQTSVFVVEYALGKLLMDWGIKPYAMIGYSIGEYTAACLSGVFSLQDALFLVANRAKLIDHVEQGAMLAVSLPEKEIAPLLKEGISFAAVNTPDLCIVSGKTTGIGFLEKQLEEKKAVFRRLKTFQAFHSPMMEAVRDKLTAVFKKVTLKAPRIPYISNVTGTWVSAEEVTKPDYWVSHTVSPIRFARGIGELLSTTCNFFLEIGPGNSLCGFTVQHPVAKQKKIADRFVLTSMPGQNENVSGGSFLLRAIGKLWAAGMEIDWPAYYRDERSLRRKVPLPPYPFERKRFWLEPATAEPEANRSAQVNRGGVRIAKRENIADWFYLPCWKQSVPPLSCTDEPEEGGRWLFFFDNDDNSIGPDLIESLKLKNTPRRAAIVKIGERYEKQEEDGIDVYRIAPGRYEDYTALLDDLGQHETSVDKIVHIWQWNSNPDFLNRGVYSLLYLVKAMSKISMFDTVELWVVSKGLHHIESYDKCSPQKAMLLGPCKVITQEYPNIICRSIDFAEEEAVDKNLRQAVRKLTTELLSSPPERIVAYRGSNRWLQTYEPAKLEKSPSLPPVLREKGVYMITGGLGRIGLSIAQYLAAGVQARLVLTTRSVFPDQDPEHPKVKAVQQLRKMGAEVLVIRADAADAAQMREAVKQAEEKFSTIHGVLHAAGVMDENAFKLIADCDREDCELHFAPKIRGLMVLEEVLRHQKLDFCILTSSLSPLLGGLSLFSYSAANSFMDIFAHKQALEHGKNWLSINWADWEREEPANDACANLVLGSTVFQLNISAAEGKETFERILSLPGSGIPEIVISSGDLQRRLQQWVLPTSGKKEDDSGENSAREQQVHQRPQLQSIYEEPKNEPEKIVVEIWQDLLGIEMVGVHDNFFELGGHSLIATKLISRLREIFRIDIPLPTLFDRPTIREVVDNIVNEWGDAATVEEIAQTYREVYS